MITTQRFLQIFFIIGIVMLNLSVFANETVTITEADDVYRISAKGYKAVVQKNGNLRSLNISGTEMLDDKVSIPRGTHFNQSSGVAKVDDTTLRAANEQTSVEYEFLPDAIFVKVKQNAGDVVPWSIVFSKKVKQVKNLDADEMDYTPVAKNWTNVRFTARSGAFIELRNGSIWAWKNRQIWALSIPKDEEKTVRIQTGQGEPLPKTPRDWLVCTFKLNSNDGIYKGEQKVEVTANIRSRAIDQLPMVFTFQVKDYDGEMLQNTKDELKVEGEGITKWKGAFKPTVPGFYDISITLESKGILVKNEKRTIGYEPEKLAPELYREDDFADFWKATLEELAQVPMAAVVTPNEGHTSEEVKTYKVNFAALDNKRVYGWYCVPASEGRKLKFATPGLLVLPGYGDRGISAPVWLAKDGFAAIAIQVRGNDVDMPKYEGKGYMALGIESPQNYVYRGIYAFCIRAVDFLCSRPEVDGERIGVLGGSQGGGLSLATAALDRRIKGCAPDVPYLSDYPEAVRWAGWPYNEIADYLEQYPQQKTQVFRTLSYFDVMNLSPDIRCPVVMGIGLLDRICPPPTEFAAYNRITAQKQYRAYPLAGHGLPGKHWNYKMRWLNRVLKPTEYICYRTAGDINVDGQLYEPSWKTTPKTERFADIESGLRVPLNTVAKMLWDDEYFYIGFICEEPDVWATLTERDSVIYADNDVEVFIDPDDDTLNYYELEINALNTVWDLLLSKPYNKGGRADNSWDIEGLKHAVKINGTLNQPEDTDKGWTVELAFPWKALAQYSGKMSSPPQNGDRWRVNFSRVERIRNSDKRDCDNWVWAVQRKINMHIPERWGYVTFSSDVVGGK